MCSGYSHVGKLCTNPRTYRDQMYPWRRSGRPRPDLSFYFLLIVFSGIQAWALSRPVHPVDLILRTLLQYSPGNMTLLWKRFVMPVKQWKRRERWITQNIHLRSLCCMQYSQCIQKYQEGKSHTAALPPPCFTVSNNLSPYSVAILSLAWRWDEFVGNGVVAKMTLSTKLDEWSSDWCSSDSVEPLYSSYFLFTFPTIVEYVKRWKVADFLIYLKNNRFWHIPHLIKVFRFKKYTARVWFRINLWSD